METRVYLDEHGVPFLNHVSYEEVPTPEWCDPKPAPESILEEALRITGGDRRRDYDAAEPNHKRIAALWEAYNQIRKPGPEQPIDVVAKMILLKLARNAYTPKRDNWTDIAGYARCGAQIEKFEP